MARCCASSQLTDRTPAKGARSNIDVAPPRRSFEPSVPPTLWRTRILTFRHFVAQVAIFTPPFVPLTELLKERRIVLDDHPGLRSAEACDVVGVVLLLYTHRSSLVRLFVRREFFEQSQCRLSAHHAAPRFGFERSSDHGSG